MKTLYKKTEFIFKISHHCSVATSIEFFVSATNKSLLKVAELHPIIAARSKETLSIDILWIDRPSKPTF